MTLCFQPTFFGRCVALNFRIKEDSLVIYSLGHDGDDDGGVNTASETPWLDKTGDGDWIVWPQADM